MLKFLRGVVLPLLLIILLGGQALAAKTDNSAISAVLIDCKSGRVLYEKNADEKRLIASTTKLMTALVAVESQPDLSRKVIIKPDWTGVEGSSIYLRAQEEMSLETLVYGLLLHSGNDAAVAIAGFCAGDTEHFVAWMNLRAADLGMTRSHFENPNGLDDEAHYSTASDMAKLARACLENETLAKIMRTKSASMDERSFTNHNKLLWQYEYCVGMKTGYTQMAGRTLVSAAEKDGQTLAVVTLTDPNDWRDHKSLLEYGFETFPETVFVQQGDELSSLPVEGSLLRSVAVYAKDSISYPLAEGERTRLVIDLPERVQAPITKDALAGRVRVFLGERCIGESYLLYGADITRDAVVANRTFLSSFSLENLPRLPFGKS